MLTQTARGDEDAVVAGRELPLRLLLVLREHNVDELPLEVSLGEGVGLVEDVEVQPHDSREVELVTVQEVLVRHLSHRHLSAACLVLLLRYDRETEIREEEDLLFVGEVAPGARQLDVGEGLVLSDVNFEDNSSWSSEARGHFSIERGGGEGSPEVVLVELVGVEGDVACPDASVERPRAVAVGQSVVVGNLLDDGGEVVGHSGVLLGSEGSVEIRVEERSGVGVDTSREESSSKSLSHVLHLF